MKGASHQFYPTFDRINKINEKLNNVQLNFHSEINQNNKQFEERLMLLDKKNYESQEDLLKEFSEIKRDLKILIQNIDDEHKRYQFIYEQKKNNLKNLENKLFI